MNYWEKLKDPRWQKKRLEVFARDGWKCQSCNGKVRALHVRALLYKGEPWESPLNNLETLCENCYFWRESFNEYWGGRSKWSTLYCKSFWWVFKSVFDVNHKSKVAKKKMRNAQKLHLMRFIRHWGLESEILKMLESGKEGSGEEEIGRMF